MNKALKAIRKKIQERKDLIAIAKDEVLALERAYNEAEGFYDNLALVRKIKPASNSDNSNTLVGRYKDRATGDMYIFTLTWVRDTVLKVIVYIDPETTSKAETFLSFPLFFMGDEANEDAIFEAAIEEYMLIRFGL